MRDGPCSARTTRSPVRFVVWLIAVGTMVLTTGWAQDIGSQTKDPFPQPFLALAGGVFEIDGNLLSGGPDDTGTDWLQGPAGTSVLNPDGSVKDATRTTHKIDLTGNADANRFFTGIKVQDDPNTYQWTASGQPPPKDDIQHGLIHFFKDGGGDQWVAVAGDRRSTNGTSYIDFEFLQSSLTANGDGTFTSLGPDGGRTNGDFLLTIELTKGGVQADFFAQIWRFDNVEMEWSYMDTTIAANDGFVAANVDSTAFSTYPVFGGSEYEVNAFGEAAANLTSIMGIGECFNIASIFIRTKSSASPTSELKDFIEPFAPGFCPDETPPQITFCPPDVTVNCDESTEPEDLGFAEGSDNCPAPLMVSFNDIKIPGECPQEFVLQRIWTVQDSCGNAAPACTTVITVVDTTAPSISGPGNISVQCIDDVPPADTSLVSGSDNCGDVVKSHLGDSPAGTCPTVITRTYRIEDECGNTNDWVQTITVNDTIPPQITCPSDVTVLCANDVPSPDTSQVTASDNCGNVVKSHVGDVPAGTCPTVITRTYKAVDDCGNESTCQQLITVNDSIPPSITCPADTSVQCAADVPPVDTNLVVASDNCGPVGRFHVSDVSNGQTCPEVITRTYKAVDGCGNESTCQQLITIDDDTPPSITCPPDTTVQCVGDVPPVDTSLVVASDNCGVVSRIHMGDVSDGKTCPEKITRTYKAVDACGNETTCQQIITIDDDTPPSITCPPDTSVQCAGDVPPPDIGDVTASDNCGPVTKMHVSDVSDGKSCPEKITRTYKAVDDCGNETTCQQIITIDDTTPPVITQCPQDISVQCIADVPSPDTNLVDATDNCGPVAITHISDVSNGQTCPEVITRTYRATDQCGNTADCVQMITVDDTQNPTISCPNDTTITCPDEPVFGTPTAMDNCDPNPEIIIVSTVVEDNCHTRTWKAVDDCGNESATCSQKITVECPNEEFCSFTQGFYGNYGGKFNGQGTLSIIQDLLSGSPLVVGKGNRKLTIPQIAAFCIVVRLPAGGTATSLPDIGQATLWEATCQVQGSPQLPVDSNGKFVNVLLGQVIALSLNVRFDTNLPDFQLSSTFCTQPALPGPNGILGDEDDIPSGPISQYSIPGAVLTALGNLGLDQDVGGLLELANCALANKNTGGASFSQINNAVSTINEAFDECRFVVPCPPLVAAASGKDSGPDRGAGQPQDEPALADRNLPTKFELSQNYPNPFNPNTTITMALPQASPWKLNIYNVSGQLVRTFTGRTSGPAYVDVQWDARDLRGAPLASGVYLYRVVAGDFVQVRKMVLLK